MVLPQTAAASYLRTMRDSTIFAVAMLLKVKVGKAADIPHSLHKDSILAYKLQDAVCAVGQGEEEHKGGEQDAGHLLHKLAGLRTI